MVGFGIGIMVTVIYFIIAAFSRHFKKMYINILNIILSLSQALLLALFGSFIEILIAWPL